MKDSLLHYDVHGENEDIDTEAEMLEDVGIEGANMGL
jgi:hypothetical protein